MDQSSKIDGKKLFEKAENFKFAKIRLSYIRGHIHIQLITKNVKQHWLYLFDLFLEDFVYN
jgi:transcription-repair coupling factor (superfamily II helicase)